MQTRVSLSADCDRTCIRPAALLQMIDSISMRVSLHLSLREYGGKAIGRFATDSCCSRCPSLNSSISGWHGRRNVPRYSQWHREPHPLPCPMRSRPCPLPVEPCPQPGVLNCRSTCLPCVSRYPLPDRSCLSLDPYSYFHLRGINACRLP